jgi:hypothetical protein
MSSVWSLVWAMESPLRGIISDICDEWPTVRFHNTLIEFGLRFNSCTMLSAPCSAGPPSPSPPSLRFKAHHTCYDGSLRRYLVKAKNHFRILSAASTTFIPPCKSPPTRTTKRCHILLRTGTMQQAWGLSSSTFPWFEFMGGD